MSAPPGLSLAAEELLARLAHAALRSPLYNRTYANVLVRWGLARLTPDGFLWITDAGQLHYAQRERERRTRR